uniref:Alpha-mannosidase n=1 Tax=Globodera pallida TaxID=36090 RepID=A0A183BP52_GLOPA
MWPRRAQLLADQYRKKAQLYGTTLILVPLGDDFRFDQDSEWNNQYSNYKMLFEFMNAKKEWNINARFGTLGDYFDALERRLAEKLQDDVRREGSLRHSVRRPEGNIVPAAASASLSLLPVLSGDFFTYADRDDHYWSGFFTSRPFYKHMDRTLQHLLRAADTFYTMARWHSAEKEDGAGKFDLNSLFDALVRARRALSLFQHHDGVTGTARTHVMTDYGEKMAQALEDSKRVLAHSVQRLLGISVPPSGQLRLRVDEAHFVDRLPQKFVLEANSALAITNPLGHSRRQVICVHVDSVKRRIDADTGGEKGQKTDIAQQIGPVLFVDLQGRLAHFHDKFELCFVAELPPFSMVRYRLIESEHSAHKVTIRHVFELDRVGPEAKTVSIQNAHLHASFDASSGLLKSIRHTPNAEIAVELSFVHYGARTHDPTRKDLGGDSRSGAYLFLPDGPAKPLAVEENTFLVVSGPIRQYVYVKGPVDIGIRHQIVLDVDAQHLAILNLVNLATESGTDRGNRLQNGRVTNFELAMRLRVLSMRQDNFFTDLNGFQMIRRRRQPQLPLQAHFYPMPGAAFVEDTDIRLSLLGRQALGVASLEQGEMQVMLDRRLAQDDDRGLGQVGVARSGLSLVLPSLPLPQLGDCAATAL